MARTFLEEADDCRKLADEVTTSAEKDMLHRIAHEFDRLSCEVTLAERPIYAARASQELTAAAAARHPRARSAHLAMARHYGELAR